MAKATEELTTSLVLYLQFRPPDLASGDEVRPLCWLSCLKVGHGELVSTEDAVVFLIGEPETLVIIVGLM